MLSAEINAVYSEAAFPLLVYLPNAPTTVHRAWRQVYNCNTVSTTGLCDQHLYSCTRVKCLSGHCYPVPTTRALDHSTYLMVLTVHTRHLSVKYKRGNATRSHVISKQTFVIALTLGKRSSGQYLHKCTVPTSPQICTNDKGKG